MSAETTGTTGTVNVLAAASRPISLSAGWANRWLAIALTTLVCLAPLPLGGNRPQFWGAVATLLAIIGTAYTWNLYRNGSELRFSLVRLWPVATLQFVLAAYLLIQSLPLGHLWSITFTNWKGEAFAAGALSLTPGSTFLMMVRILSYGALFVLMAQVSVNRARARRILVVLFYVITAYGMLGLLLLAMGDTLLGLRKWAYHGSATGPFVNRNSFATFLAMGLAIGVALLAEVSVVAAPLQKKLTDLAALVAGLLVTTGALLTTESRMGAVAAACGSVVVLALASRKLKLSWARWTVIGLILAIATLAALTVFGSGVLERMISIEGAADIRGDLYAQVGEMIRARPLLGWGGDSFELSYPLFHRPPVLTDAIWNKAHSTYLALWVELGLIFGSIPLLVVALLAVVSLRVFFASRSGWVVGLAAVGAFVVAAVHSTVDFSLEIPANAYLLTALLALASGVSAPADMHSPSRQHVARVAIMRTG